MVTGIAMNDILWLQDMNEPSNMGRGGSTVGCTNNKLDKPPYTPGESRLWNLYCRYCQFEAPILVILLADLCRIVRLWPSYTHGKSKPQDSQIQKNYWPATLHFCMSCDYLDVQTQATDDNNDNNT